MGFTLIIPVHNEEPILEANAKALDDYLNGIQGLKYEIILSCNGCTDGSEDIARRLAKSRKSIRHLSIEGRGLGNAIREAVYNASYEMMMFYAIDLPFGLDIIGQSIEASVKNNNSVVIGSKGHRESKVERGAARRLFSGTISFLNNLLFGLGVKDTQGSILFYKEPFRRYGKLMDSPGAFFQTQILIYSSQSGQGLLEIPVDLNKDMRKTRFSLAKDGLRYISALFREKKKLMAARKP